MNAGALDGIKVLEFASYVSGPFAGMLLSDLGAEVVKGRVARGRRSDRFRAPRPAPGRLSLALAVLAKSLWYEIVLGNQGVRPSVS